MTEHFYRYRPIKAVLDGFRELENQEIYFSATNELNDPMEGFKDLFWLGDEIVWRNLLRHYMLAVLQTAAYCFTAGDRFDRNILAKIVFGVPQSLPEAPIREIYTRLSAELLAEPVAEKFVSLMASRRSPLRRSELTSYLRALHGFAMQILLKEYQERGVLRPHPAAAGQMSREDLTRHAIAMLEGVTKITSSEVPPERIAEAIFTASEGAAAQILLVNEYNYAQRTENFPIVFLATRFPLAYVTALEKLVHRDWYVGCFAKTAESHSMWSTYADGHRGVCLMFKSAAIRAGARTLILEQVNSVSGGRGSPMIYHKGHVNHEFKEVIYATQYPSIDFFRSLGAISARDVHEFWYRGDGGSFSECRSDLYFEPEKWRAHYWQTFGESVLYKTPEWRHEEEFRIVLHSLFDLSAKEDRKLKYRFESLAGIVFGARTDIEDKLKIIRIIDAKCAAAKRSDFKFYEIRYLATESRFQLFPLDLLQIKY
jgi:hypothetical protein